MHAEISRIVRSKRKTFGLEITPEADLIVRVPMRASDKDIQKTVDKKIKWILAKQKLVRERCDKKQPRAFAEGEYFFYLGNQCKLYIMDNASTPLYFDSGSFILSARHAHKARDVFTKWYRKQAYDKFCQRASFFSAVSGLRYRKISISNAKRRWGSCSGKDNLNFNWRLIMAPLDIIDYVVVHELCHIEEKNHSKRFWDKVRNMMPDYKERRAWLKEKGHSLCLQD
ncbi:MAG: M48 family peptidase [Candidatus Nanohalarchaeota archaeon]|nr:MAG: M48 family peptidase [Candidatus Nanohaloarchaeota archaeon]